MNFNLVKFVVASCFLFFNSIFVFSQTTTTHIVDKGETLATIAQKYNTTEAKLLELNPDASQFVYVGMELVLPTVSKVEVDSISSKIDETSLDVLKTQKDKTNDLVHYVDGIYEDCSKWQFAMSLSYGFLPGKNGTNWTFSVSAGANYNITKTFYVGARIGYNSVNFMNQIHLDIAEYYNTEISSHMIYLPLEFGYRLVFIENKLGLYPYLGLDLNYVVKSTVEQGLGSNKEKSTINPDDRFGVNGRIGFRLSLWGFNLGCAYVFSMDENFGDNSGFPEISIGLGF